MEQQKNGPYPSAQDIQTALAQLFESSAFARSERMRAFLEYVVTETLAGRSSSIRAKTIAHDVYGRDPSQEDYSENIVRVDARRLRRLLEEHYAEDGVSALVKIRIAKGTYVPTFEVARPVSEEPVLQVAAAPHGTPKVPLVSALVGGFALAAVTAVFLFGPSSQATTKQTSSAERVALFEKSGAVLQADNLCRQGRGTLFPIADAANQAVATDVFLRAVELAPDYPCGFAGAGHSLATQALLSQDPALRDALLGQASEMAHRAQSLAPADGWAVSAVAWSAYANGRLERASELSKLSEQLSPRDGNVLDFHGVISVLTGNYDEARRATDPVRPRDTNGLGHAHRNIYGVASFHAKDYDAAIEAWGDAIRLGEPVSALTLMYLTAAHQARGDTHVAAEFARDLQAGWPSFPLVGALKSFYPDDRVSSGIVDLLIEAGWRPSQNQSASSD
ncbi:MAG: hypothetical protein NXH97_23505 [Rhodobacteraceae bacterium]|nr:hypothetical protein [Paracoccaceae bacterium]